MSQALTLARPYARAAFGTASDAGELPRWSSAFAFAAQVAGDPQVSAILGSPRLTQGDAVALLSPEDASAAFGRFLALLAENRRLHLLPEIAGLYEQMRAEAESVVRARLISAQPMTYEDLESYRALLQRRFGRRVDLTLEVDESLIGGAIIDTGEKVIDGSVKGKLARLQAALAQ